jgi:hypothetical protein
MPDSRVGDPVAPNFSDHMALTRWRRQLPVLVDMAQQRTLGPPSFTVVALMDSFPDDGVGNHNRVGPGDGVVEVEAAGGVEGVFGAEGLTPDPPVVVP